MLQGGLSTGRTLTDDCGVKPDNPSQLYCRTETPYLTQVKLLGSYRLPWDVQLSGTFQNIPGPQVLANAVFTSAQVAPSLGRPLASASTVTVNVVPPGTMYGERLTQLDFRVSKSVRVGRTRIEGQFDIYNALNGNAVYQMNNTYGTTGASWMSPQRILAARLFKFGMQVDF